LRRLVGSRACEGEPRVAGRREVRAMRLLAEMGRQRGARSSLPSRHATGRARCSVRVAIAVLGPAQGLQQLGEVQLRERQGLVAGVPARA